MKVLIVEDEAMAAERLVDLIHQYDASITVLDQLDTVSGAVQWLKNNPKPDLAFFDIQLADGSSFQIFDQVEVDCPVIFTTAYDQYALKAFKVNSIDYLLKPLDLEELTKAFQQFESLQQRFEQPQTNALSMDNIQRAMQMLTQQYKSRFVIKSGHTLTAVPTEAIAYFFSEHKLTWLVHEKGKKFSIDYTLEQLEGLVDPKQFYRLNRKFLASFKSIEKVVSYTNSRLKVHLQQHPKSDEVLISREKATAFKRWMDGG